MGRAMFWAKDQERDRRAVAQPRGPGVTAAGGGERDGEGAQARGCMRTKQTGSGCSGRLYAAVTTSNPTLQPWARVSDGCSQTLPRASPSQPAEPEAVNIQSTR